MAPKPELKKMRLPLNDLPMTVEEIIKDIDAVIITHTHYDTGMNMQQRPFLKIFLFLSKMLLIKK